MIMISLPPGYKPCPVTDLDREISLTCWGFTIGFGILIIRGAWNQTKQVTNRFRIRSPYIWFLWIDIICTFGFGCSAWFYMEQYVKGYDNIYDSRMAGSAANSGVDFLLLF